jgi:hypothetical protein
MQILFASATLASSRVIADIALQNATASSSDRWWMFLPVAFPTVPPM